MARPRRYRPPARDYTTGRVLSPEACLCFALIKEAWHCLFKPPRSRLRRAAQIYLLGPNDPTCPIPRDHACAMIGIEPQVLGKRVCELVLGRMSNEWPYQRLQMELHLKLLQCHARPAAG